MKYTTLLIFIAVCSQVVFAARKEVKKPKPEQHYKKGFIDNLNKGKRETGLLGFPGPGPLRSSHISHFHPGGSSLSIGAGYSLGGSKTSSLGPISSHSIGGGHGGYSYPKPSFHGPNPSPSVSKIRYTTLSGSYYSPNALNGFGTNKYGGGVYVGGGNLHAPQFASHVSSSGPHSSFGSSFGSTKSQGPYGISQYAALAKPVGSHSVPPALYNSPGIPSEIKSSSSSSTPSYAAGVKGLGAYASSNIPQFSSSLFSPASEHEMSMLYAAPSGPFSGADAHGNLFLPEVSGNSLGGYSSSKKLAELLNGRVKSSSISSGGPSHNAFKPSAYIGSADIGLGSGHQSLFSSHGGSSGGHSSSFSNSPVYLAPKVISGGSHGSLGGQSGGAFHGSASLTGSYEIPSAGHAASSLNFAGSSGGYSSPVVGYGSLAFGHDSDVGSQLSSSLGHNSLSLGHGGQSIGFGSVSGGYMIPGGGHGTVSSFDGLSGDTSGPGSGYSSVIKHDASSSSYVSTSPYSDGAYAGSSGYSVNDINAEKHDIPQFVGGMSSAFSSAGQGSSSISPFGDHKYSGLGNSFGNLKGSYSSQNNVYVSPTDEQYNQSESKYDTIKYSREISEGEILKH